MGGLESKFNALLVDGRREEAESIWAENLDLQSRFRPNIQIKASPTRDTPLHCTVRHEMQVGRAYYHHSTRYFSKSQKNFRLIWE